MDEPVHVIRWKRSDPTDDSPLLEREWLVTNGLGGYASGTLAGVATRRYHGYLIAALPNPLGRTVMLNHLIEEVRLPDGSMAHFGGREQAGGKVDHGAEHLQEFRLEMGLPVWTYGFGDVVLEKRVLLPHGQNSVHVGYRLVKGSETVRLLLRPSLHFRPQEAPVSTPLGGPYLLSALEDRLEVSSGYGTTPLRLYLHGERTAFTVEGRRVDEVLYRMERDRGYENQGELWTPGYFQVDLTPGGGATLVGSTESWDTVLALSPEAVDEAERARRARLLSIAPPALRAGVAAELVLASDQFIVAPEYRATDVARARAAGEEMRTVIAGYHWFTDWGRDTMISLEGLTLTTGRGREAGAILRTFAHYARHGLIPNMFPDGSNEGLYHTADATLWFFHAISRYLEVTSDRTTLRLILPTLRTIVQDHLKGTLFGIGVDPDDGLLRQGEQGYQLTWMDAKCDGWVVTPRRGKAVEINALWYNAIRLLEGWLREEGDAAGAAELATYAAKVYASFNRRFWYADGGYLYDVVDGEKGNDGDCRPNQVFAISLPHPVLQPDRWEPVLRVVRERLLTPVGLRSLAPGDPQYRSVYHGDLPSRDAAYHQGTVWGWLIGPYVDAFLRAHPESRAEARELLDGLIAQLDDFGVGTIGEIFDAEPPFKPRGCIAQAWSVAEVLRCWAKTAEPA
jgi:predicted glycogen debranching enzyme